LVVAGATFVADVLADRCGACGEELIEGSDLARFELRIAQWLAGAGVRSGETLRFMRKALGLRSADLGELLGVRLETVSRWETGALKVDAHAFALLGALVDDRLAGSERIRTRLEVLRAKPKKLPAEVRLEVA
jgi:putative zinc finger/helix-turn-helix YgiT family protein